MRSDGTTLPFRNGRLAGAWTLAPDRRSMKIGSSQLSLAGGEIALDVDNEKRGVKIHLRFRLGPRARSIRFAGIARPAALTVTTPASLASKPPPVKHISGG